MLNSKQKKCIEMMALGDRTQKEIAEQLKVTEATICNWKKNEDFQTEYIEFMRQNLKGAVAKAFNTELQLLNARSEMVRLLAAKDVLDRAGVRTDDNINANNDTDLHITIDYGDLSGYNNIAICKYRTLKV